MPLLTKQFLQITIYFCASKFPGTQNGRTVFLKGNKTLKTLNQDNHRSTDLVFFLLYISVSRCLCSFSSTAIKLKRTLNTLLFDKRFADNADIDKTFKGFEYEVIIVQDYNAFNPFSFYINPIMYTYSCLELIIYLFFIICSL